MVARSMTLVTFPETRRARSSGDSTSTTIGDSSIARVEIRIWKSSGPDAPTTTAAAPVVPVEQPQAPTPASTPSVFPDESAARPEPNAAATPSAKETAAAAPSASADSDDKKRAGGKGAPAAVRAPAKKAAAKGRDYGI